jgi:hypothetical protein
MYQYSVGLVLQSRLYETTSRGKLDQEIFILQIGDTERQMVRPSGREIWTDSEDVGDTKLFAQIWRLRGGQTVAEMNDEINVYLFENDLKTTYSLR